MASQSGAHWGAAEGPEKAAHGWCLGPRLGSGTIQPAPVLGLGPGEGSLQLGKRVPWAPSSTAGCCTPGTPDSFFWYLVLNPGALYH